MIRFILKTIEERPTFCTVDVKNNDFAPLNNVLMWAKYEIIGAEHFVEFDKVILGDMRITSNGVSFASNSEPKFPEKYTPVIVRDGDDESWMPELFLQKDKSHQELWFDCVNCSYQQIAPLMGNEKLIETNQKPPFYWKVKDKTAELIKS